MTNITIQYFFLLTCQSNIHSPILCIRWHILLAHCFLVKMQDEVKCFIHSFWKIHELCFVKVFSSSPNRLNYKTELHAYKVISQKNEKEKTSADENIPQKKCG